MTLFETVAIVFGSTGLWALIQTIYTTRAKRKDKHEEKEEESVKDTLLEIKNGISQIESDLQKNSDLTKAISRDRINSLCNKFLTYGYIPLSDSDSFFAIGDAYLNAGGNSSVGDKYRKVKAELPIRED